jgi:GABA permease
MRARRVLILADQTADSRELVVTIERLANVSPCAFTVLVPVRARGVYRGVGPGQLGVSGAAAWLDGVLPVLSRAAGDEVIGLVGREEPLTATRDALDLLGFDEVIISMPPARASRWLHLDLPRRVRALGVPVSHVINAALGDDGTEMLTASTNMRARLSGAASGCCLHRRRRRSPTGRR